MKLFWKISISTAIIDGHQYESNSHNWNTKLCFGRESLHDIAWETKQILWRSQKEDYIKYIEKYLTLHFSFWNAFKKLIKIPKQYNNSLYNIIRSSNIKYNRQLP